MEYVFGTVRIGGVEYENVKSVGDSHTDLNGFCHIERHYTDNIISDDFKVVEKYQTDTQGDICLDWYIIENHRRTEDKFTPAKEGIKNDISENSDGVFDIASLADENSECIEELANMLEGIEERLSLLEEV